MHLNKIQSWEYIAGLWRGRNDMPSQPDIEKNAETQQMLREQFIFSRAMRAGEHEYDLGDAWRRIVARRRRAIFRRVVRYAAVVALILAGWSVWLLLDGESSSLQTAETIQIAPGFQQAKLVLSDGKSIALAGGDANDQLRMAGASFENAEGSLRQTQDAGQKSAAGQKYSMLVVPKCGEYHLELADGTHIWLNSETTLRFPERFDGPVREVYLDGEAYFKVAHDASRPFVVRIGEERIKVLGTSFNLCAYGDETLWQTTLVEGSIMFGDDIRLAPNEQLTLNRSTGARQKQRIEEGVSDITAWVEGLYHFESSTFESVMKKLERWYDFQIVYTDERIRQMRFTGLVDKHENISRMLSRMESTTDLKFTVEGRVITASTTPG